MAYKYLHNRTFCIITMVMQNDIDGTKNELRANAN